MQPKTILFVDQRKQPAGYIETTGRTCGASEHLTLREAFALIDADVQLTFPQFKRKIKEMSSQGQQCVLTMEKGGCMFLDAVDKMEMQTIALPETELAN
jgi:hypothetical protein